MNVAIIGTRGIPNNYGGFEQLAEYLSVWLVQNGAKVTVYNSSLHTYKESTFKGVTIIRCKDPENVLGTFGQFFYDLNCIRDCRKHNYDVILQLGYTSSSVWSFLFPKNSKIVTNMDGLEWKRTKYSLATKFFLKKAEKWAVKYSDVLIADSIGIQEYFENEYNIKPKFIPYGAMVPSVFPDSILQKYNLSAKQYYLIIARMEPENNIETIIRGFIRAKVNRPLVIIGSHENKHGSLLYTKYKSDRVIFLGPIYKIETLNALRHYCKMYFHGHSVGGTNPSLLEAMASGAHICAHKNVFNEKVLGTDANYFLSEQDVSEVIMNGDMVANPESIQENNRAKINNYYSWQKIGESYLKAFIEA